MPRNALSVGVLLTFLVSFVSFPMGEKTFLVNGGGGGGGEGGEVPKSSSTTVTSSIVVAILWAFSRLFSKSGREIRIKN